MTLEEKRRIIKDKLNMDQWRYAQHLGGFNNHGDPFDHSQKVQEILEEKIRKREREIKEIKNAIHLLKGEEKKHFKLPNPKK